MAENCLNVDPEIRLIEDACNYLLENTYPDGASKNDKRIIRRKAQKIVVKDGEVYFKKKKGEVCLVYSYSSADLHAVRNDAYIRHAANIQYSICVVLSV